MSASNPQSHFAEVQFKLPLKRSFTYSYPAALQANISIGARIEAPFRGRGRMTGIVTALHNIRPEFQTKEIEKLVDDFDLIPTELISLANWMSEYYLCSVGEALLLMTPHGRRLSKKLKEILARHGS